MNQLDSFIAFPRNFRFKLYDNIRCLQVFILILLKATYQQTDYFAPIPLHKGQLMTTYKKSVISLVLVVVSSVGA